MNGGGRYWPDPVRRAARWFRRSERNRDATSLGRDFNCADQESPSWEERARAAVDLLRESLIDETNSPERLAIADFGAGNERLRAVLATRLELPHSYHAYDLRPQRPTTTQMDLAERFPERRFDVIFCLGLVEYLTDPAPFFQGLAKTCRSAVVSYVVFDGAEKLTPAERRERGWNTDLTRSDVARLLETSGFTLRGFTQTNQGRTGIWNVRAIAPAQTG